MLVTGGAGFAGRHLRDRLRLEGVECLAPARDAIDLCDDESVLRLVRDAQPSTVFHLAAFSSPSLSLERPAEALLTNVAMTLSVLEAVRRQAPSATVVLVGSGQAYGEPRNLPVREGEPLEPGNPYAVSKASCDMLGRQYAESYGLRVVRVRPFNHAGPGQREEYVISALARQVAQAETSGVRECVLKTGNPEAARDFTDVRDVVRAYVMASDLRNGAFNVCRGTPTAIGELVEMIKVAARIHVRHEVDPSRLRTHDTPVLYGSHERISAACGWQPEIPLEETIADTIDWWRTQLSG